MDCVSVTYILNHGGFSLKNGCNQGARGKNQNCLKGHSVSKVDLIKPK